jgi:hypothetical protein
MAERQTTARKKSRSESDDERPDAERGAEDEAGRAEAPAVDEQELASYLEERIKPGLNRGSIPLLARSIAREIAQDGYHSDEDEEDEDDGDDEPVDLEVHLHELQRRLGKEWTLYYAVQGDDSWLTAEKEDASQRLEAKDPSVLVQAVKLLTEGAAASAAARSGGKQGNGDD